MKRFCSIILLISVLIQFKIVFAEAEPRPLATRHYNGHTYAAFDINMSWNDAKALCEAYGGYLVSILSESEQEIIVDLLSNGKMNNYWLGACDEEVEGVWNWVSGEMWDYSKWYTGEPNNANDEDYLSISKSTYKWNDLSNNNSSIGFVCEWNYIKPFYDAMITYGGHTYILFDEKLQWSGALRRANLLGGYLATITSKEEQNVVSDLIKCGMSDSYYLGGTEENGIVSWITNEPSLFNHWGNGEPNEAVAGENCVEIVNHGWDKLKHGDWNDIPGDKTNRGFIIELNRTNNLVFDIYSPKIIKYYNSHMYALYDEHMSWIEAKGYCSSIGGHLATITSKNENEFLIDLCENNGQNPAYYLGATDEENEGDWRWITGEKWVYSNWKKGQPDNDYSGTENYLEMWKSQSEFLWNDCRNIYYEGNGFICEWDFAKYPDSKSTSASAPIIKSANLYDNGKEYDVITQSFSLDKGSVGLYNIKVDIDWNGILPANQEVYLTQGATTKNDSAFVRYNAIKKMFEYIPLGTVFEADKPIYIIAVDKSNPKNKSTSMLTKINIIGADGEIYNPGALIDGKNFKFGKDIELHVPEDVPVFGGTDLTWKIDFIPITIKSENGKMDVVFGLDLDEDGEFTFEEYKKSFNDYVKNLDKKNRKQNRTLKQLRNDLRMSEANKRKNKGMTMSMWGNKVFKNSSSGEADTGIDIMGYAICENGKNGWELKDGYICFEATVSYTYKGQVFIYVIPCYYSFTGSLNGKASAQIKDLDFQTFNPKFQAILEAGVGAEITGGIGVPQVAGLEATGKGSLNVKMDINNFQKDIEEYLKVYVDASASFGLTIFGQKVASKEAWHLDADKGIIYSTYPDDYDKSWIKPKRASLMSLNSIYEGYSAENVYEAESRDYLNNGMSWNTNKRKPMLMSADYSNKNLKTLAENIYPNAKPQICDINGTKVLIFTTDNAERTAQNKQMLVYSVYNEDTESWSMPQEVCDDGTADYYPQIAGEYLVWQNQKSVMEDGLSIAEIGKQGEINIAQWNGTDFDTPTALTNNNDLDTLPRIAVNGDEISVIWIKNSANDILGVDGESSLIKKVYNGSTWSAETAVKSGLNAIVDLSVGYDSNNLYIAYIPDGDGDISTIDDREIYLIGNSETQVTDNETLDSNIVIDGGKLYWYNESNICFKDLSGAETSTVFDEGKHKLAEGFTVCENNGNIAILWSSASDDEESDAAEIKGVLYQDGEWGDIIEVSSVGGRAKYPTCVLDENGKMLTAFTSETEDGTNLYTIDLTPSYDLSAEDISFNENLLSKNSTNEFELTLTNCGELPIENFTLNVYNGDGTLNHSESFDEIIKAGETKTVIAEFEISEEISLETLTVEVVVNDGEEYVTDNNSVEFKIGHCDVSIEEIRNYEMLPTSVATVVLKNIGYSDAENVAVKLRQENVDGEVIATRNIEIIEAGEETEISFEYNPKDYETTKWFVTVETDEELEEISLGNNEDYFVNECAVNLVDVEQTILNYSIEDGVLTINSFAKNNTEDVISGTAYAGVYNSHGILKGLSLQQISIESYSDTGVDFWIENYTYEEGDYIKVFVWDENISPLCDSDFANLKISE